MPSSDDTLQHLLATLDDALKGTGLHSDRADKDSDNAQCFPNLCNKLAASKIAAAVCVADDSGKITSNVMSLIHVAATPTFAQELSRHLNELNNNSYEIKTQPTRGGIFLHGAQRLAHIRSIGGVFVIYLDFASRYKAEFDK